MIERLESTIVAISSPPGPSALGIVRLSGDDALTIAHSLTGLQIQSQSTWTRSRVSIRFDENCAIPALMYVFRAPHSYTRQHLVEIHTIGSPPLLEMIQRRCVSLGALPAQPGEFTARAFLNGAMDLASAEAVAGSIRAGNDVQLRAARRFLDGDFAGRIRSARDAVGELAALVEAGIDFADEPIEFITPAELKSKLAALGGMLNDLANQSRHGERAGSAPRILLFGKPNAGKSSLMNRLAGGQRAICSQVPGTTRDVLEAAIQLDPGEAILLDCAGVDDSSDFISTLARSHTLSAADRVDLVCLVIDASSSFSRQEPDELKSLDLPPLVVALNKADLVETPLRDELYSLWASRGAASVCRVSAKTGEGVDELRRAWSDALALAPASMSPEAVVLNERQRTAVLSACESLARAMNLVAGSQTVGSNAETLAFELREALDALGQITGEVTTDDLLGQVFARFCIGK